MNSYLTIIFISFLSILISCTNTEIGKGEDVNAESIYFDYRISGDENNDNLIVMVRYRFGGENGTTLTLEKPAKVEFDNELMLVDSSKITGAYYEIQKPRIGFEGEHTITFTNYNEKKYSEKFIFQPLVLKTSLPALVKRKDMLLEVNGLNDEGLVRVILTDTSFTSEGINQIDTIKNRRVVVTYEDLKNLVNGPIQFELIKEYERPLKDVTPEGGKLSISYGLKREFILEN